MSKFTFAQSSLTHVPNLPGVYIYLDNDGRPIYVGKAKNLKKRVSTYFTKPPKYHKVQLIQEKSVDFEIIITANEHEAFLLENKLIKKHQPILNILLKDDKSFPYVSLSNHAYPRLFMTRKLDNKNKHYGPYSNVGAVKDTIDHLQRAFKIRTCRDYFFKQRTRPCLQHQINRCSAPCVGYISEKDYKNKIDAIDQFLKGESATVINQLQQEMQQASDDMNYELAAQLRDQIRRLNYIHNQSEVNIADEYHDCFAWEISHEHVSIYHIRIQDKEQVDAKSYVFDSDPVLENEEILTQFLARFYESDIDAHNCNVYLQPKLSDSTNIKKQVNALYPNISILDVVKSHHKTFLTNAELNRKMTVETLERQKNKHRLLKSLVELKDFSLHDCRIECYDVSHQQGRFTCASCIVFNESGPVKSLYRKFNLTLNTPGDDYEGIYEVIKRRYQKDQPMADLIIIDGGKGQINQCVQALEACNRINYRVIGIAKGPSRKVGLEQFFEYQEGRITTINPSDDLKYFLLSARDEAHRFAITQTRKKMTKETVGSKLETIDGVGVMKRRQLLQTFGGLQGLQSASVAQIEKVAGIGPVLAQKIYDALH